MIDNPTPTPRLTLICFTQIPLTHNFQSLHPSQKDMLPKANEQKKKNNLPDFSPKKNSESFDKN